MHRHTDNKNAANKNKNQNCKMSQCSCRKRAFDRRLIKQCEMGEKLSDSYVWKMGRKPDGDFVIMFLGYFGSTKRQPGSGQQ